MSAHEIPDDGAPHAPTSACGCGPQLRWATWRGYPRPVYVHNDQTETGGGDQNSAPWALRGGVRGG